MGKYSSNNVNVESVKSVVDTALKELSTHKTKLENIYNSLNNENNFKNCDTVKNAKNKVKDIYADSVGFEGNIKKIEKQLNKIKKGLEYVKKYQEAEKKYKTSQQTADKLYAEGKKTDTIWDDTDYWIYARAADGHQAEMLSYEKLADAAFK